MSMACASYPKDVLYSMMRKEMAAEPPLLGSEDTAAEPPLLGSDVIAAEPPLPGSEDTAAEPSLLEFLSQFWSSKQSELARPCKALGKDEVQENACSSRHDNEKLLTNDAECS